MKIYKIQQFTLQLIVYVVMRALRLAGAGEVNSLGKS